MRFTKTIASASVAAVLGLAGVSVAGATSNPGAQTSTVAQTAAATSPTAPKATTKPGQKARPWRHFRRAAGAITAKTIGIKRPQLRQELLAGKTIAAIATEHGVQPQAVIDALEAAVHARIAAAQSSNKITAARAAKLKSRFDTAIPKIVNDWHPRKAATG